MHIIEKHMCLSSISRNLQNAYFNVFIADKIGLSGQLVRNQNRGNVWVIFSGWVPFGSKSKYLFKLCCFTTH